MDVSRVYDYTPIQAQMIRFYDLYRSALLNGKYHGRKLKLCRVWASTTDTVAAVTSSSAIASLTIWQTPAGKYLFATLLLASAVSSVIRATFRLSENLDKHSRMIYAWNELAFDMEKLISAIRAKGCINDIREQQMTDLCDRFQHVHMQEEPAPDRALLIKLQDEVDQELPADHLWLPA
jgi:hypothetical protein